MTTTPIDRVSVTARVLMTAALVAASAGIALADGPARVSAGRGLEGTWTVTVTLRDCQAGSPLGNPFRSLLSFARGGTVTETTANPSFFPAVRSPGHGVWGAQRIEAGSASGRGRSYDAATTAFLTVDGVLTRTQKITQSIRMGDDPDTFDSDASVQFFDPAGRLLVTACATAVGQRFE